MDNIEFEFTRMVKEHRKTIYTVCYFFSKDADEVNDLFQEILINLWKGFPKFRGESSHRTWIWRVSLNTCNNQVRRKKRDVETVPLTIDIDLYNDDDTKSRQIQMLHDRISRLEPFDRAIILLWLKNFSEKIALSLWYFILADVLIILLVSGCVIMNSLRISRSNPVDSLKNE